MDRILFYEGGCTAACRYAADQLRRNGYAIVDHPTPEVTHLLLDAPSLGKDCLLRGGQDPAELLRMLPQALTVIGGNLEHPVFDGYAKLDLLKDGQYLACNAAITAECALQVAAEKMDTIFAGTKVLVIGWGRIGKCLGLLLKALGARVTVTARKDSDLGMIRALGLSAIETQEAGLIAAKFPVIFNTVPAPVLRSEDFPRSSHNLKIELASVDGLEGGDVVIARGLPGLLAPQSSGDLIARTLLRKIQEE